MKKSLLLITLLFATITLFAQPPQTYWEFTDIGIDAGMVMKPGKFLDDGRTIWLVSHTASAPHSTTSFRSTNGGETWLKGTTVSGTRIANIDAIDANIALMALVDGTIHKTTDGGVTWRQVHSYSPGSWFGGLKVLSNNVVIAGGDGAANSGQYYLCRSTDAGETWVQIPPLAEANADEAIFTYGSVMDSYGDNVWFALYGGSNTGETSRPVIRSTNAGVTWEVFRIPSGINIWAIAFANESIGMAMNEPGDMFLTTDGGVTWNPLTTVPTDIRIRNVTAFKVKNKIKFALIGEDANTMPVIYNTVDNGQSWTEYFIDSPQPITGGTYYSACVYDDNLGFASFRTNSVYKMVGDVVTKKFNVAGEIGTRGLVYKPGTVLDNGNIIWFCGHEVATPQNTSSFVSTDAGKTFKRGTAVTGRTSNIVAYDGTTALMATADGRIVRTIDGGTTWTQVHSYTTGAFFNGIQILGSNVVIAYGDGTTATGAPYFCKSTDRGLTFTQIPRNELPTDLGTTLYGYQTHGSCSDSYGSHAWFTLYGGSGTTCYIAKTTDNGSTWTSQEMSITGTGSASGTNGRMRSISFPTPNYGMVLNLINEIFMFANTGNTWVKCNSPARDYPQDSILIYNVTGIPETSIFIAGGVVMNRTSLSNRYYGTFVTYDLGQSWQKIDAPYGISASDYIHGGLYHNKNFGYAFTNGGNVLKLGDDIPTSVPEYPEDIIDVPKDYSLEQNYPNPFNPSTTIRFTLNKTEHVRLIIYDILGKEIRTLLDNTVFPGEHSLVFEARGLSSGVYFYTLQVGNAFETKKMVLMK